MTTALRDMSQAQYLKLAGQRARPKVPSWAAELVGQVCFEESSRVPRVSWRNCRHKQENSTGRTHLGPSGSVCSTLAHIHVSQGWYLLDAEMTLLHELAHWTTREAHTPAMFAQAFKFYARYLEDAEFHYAQCNELAYKPKSAWLGLSQWARASGRIIRLNDEPGRLEPKNDVRPYGPSLLIA